MGGSELGTCAKIVVALLVIINIIFGALGIVVFAIGIYTVVEGQNYSLVTGNDVISGGAILIAAGVVTMIITFVGIIGAIFKLRPLLALYAVAVFIIVVLEIAAGSLAFVFRDDVVDEIETRSLEAIRDYRVEQEAMDRDEEVNDFVAFIQDALDCCGVNSATDWFLNNSMAVQRTLAMAQENFPACDACNADRDDDCDAFPDPSGVVPQRINATTRGCLDITSDRVTVIAYSAGAIGIVFGIMEILGIVFALLLCCCITTARKQEVV